MQDNPAHDELIRRKFQELRNRNEGALIAYLTGGDPDPKAFLANSTALIEAGADILEVGIPFSDPIADGPVIQASSRRALSRGATPAGILDLIGELSSRFQLPFVVLTYYNPILAMGIEHFMMKAHQSGVSGVVVPDLPVEEGDRFRDMALKHNIDTIYLAAPNTSHHRLVNIIEKSKGFLYLVSLYGVTGPRDKLSPQALESVRRVKSLSKETIPVSAGFGITTPAHVSSLIQSGADGVIVGSALVRIVAQHLDEPGEAPHYLKRIISDLKEATRQGPL